MYNKINMSLFRTFRATSALRTSRMFPQQFQFRSMSLIALEGEEEVENFRALNSKSILMFTATWCPPCKVIKPVYENLSKENTDVAMATVDVDENSDSALEFEINAVPTFVFFDGEKAVNKMAGADSNQLTELLKDLKSR